MICLDNLVSFLDKYYFDSYIKDGGAKIKFLTGKKGSGKTSLVQEIAAQAEKNNMYCVSLDASTILLSDFSNIYKEVIKNIDFDDLLNKLSETISSRLGFAWKASDGRKFMDYLYDEREAGAMVRNEIRSQLKEMFTMNPLLDYNFAICISSLVAMKLGFIGEDENQKKDLLNYLKGNNEQKLSYLKRYGIIGSKINKYNSRNMLRSLSEILHLANYSGLFIALDNIEFILSKNSLSPIHYSKMRRDDTYESIRALIDDIDNFGHTFFLLSFSRILMDDEKAGIKSYQALFLRVQNEIISSNINYFSDLIDLDKVYSKEMTTEIVKKFIFDLSGKIITDEDANKLLDKAKLSTFSVIKLMIDKAYEEEETK